MKRVFVVAAMLLLAGCATTKPQMIAAPVHHQVTKPVAAPPVVAPPVPTFCQRWPSKFFRNRAAQ